MRNLQAILIFLICLTGCSSIPFQKTTYVPLDRVEPWSLVERFKNNSPENFRQINTIVFEFNWNKMSAIGYIDVNTKKQTFTVVGINHLGIKLFELSGDRNRIETYFLIEQFSEKGNFTDAVGEDIRRIYFDLIPSSEAKVKKKRHRIKFSEPFDVGVIEYTFAGTGGYLIEKDYYEEGILNWTVSYYEYQQKCEKVYPSGIILKNYKYGYTLTIRLKEVLD